LPIYLRTSALSRRRPRVRVTPLASKTLAVQLPNLWTEESASGYKSARYSSERDDGLVRKEFRSRMAVILEENLVLPHIGLPSLPWHRRASASSYAAFSRKNLLPPIGARNTRHRMGPPLRFLLEDWRKGAVADLFGLRLAAGRMGAHVQPDL